MFSHIRCLARDRPAPYGEGGVFPVARGPVPRDLSTGKKRPSLQRFRRFLSSDAWRGTGPRPTMKRRRFFTVARGPVPRDLSTVTKTRDSDVFSHIRYMARDRPAPYDEGKASAAGPPYPLAVDIFGNYFCSGRCKSHKSTVPS